MKKKDEKLVDSRLAKMGIAPRIYHFDIRVEPFTAISIAVTKRTWASTRLMLDDICGNVLTTIIHEKATRMRQELRERNIYGVAICDGRDSLNRQRGRTIAKGRLWKHLKRMEKENE